MPSCGLRKGRGNREIGISWKQGGKKWQERANFERKVKKEKTEGIPKEMLSFIKSTRRSENVMGSKATSQKEKF